MALTDTGAGAAPAGSCLAGFGTPAFVPAPVPQSYAQGAAVAIDPVRRDYTFDANGNRNRMTSSQQLVYLALLTVQGSSAVASLGLASIGDVIADRTRSVVRQAVYTALLPYTSSTPPMIQIVSVDVVRKTPASLQMVVVWRDLSTRQESTTLVPLGGG